MLVVNFRRSAIIAELWQPEVARPKNFRENFACFGKTPHYGKIFKILFRKFLSRHRSTFCVQISWNVAYGKSVKSYIAYLAEKQNFASLSICRYCTNRAKNLQGPAAVNILRVLQISSKSVHFRRTGEHRQNALSKQVATLLPVVSTLLLVWTGRNSPWRQSWWRESLWWKGFVKQVDF